MTSLHPAHRRLLCDQWFITEHAFAAMQLTLATIINEKGLSAFLMDIQKRDPLAYDLEDGVATIRMSGALGRNLNDFEKVILGMTDYAEVENALEQAASADSVGAILLDINSPGGTVNGTPEVAALVAEISQSKPVVAYTDGMMASAAYYIGSQASAVLAAPSANVGSVGTVLSFFDISGLLNSMGVKAEVFTNADSPLKATGAPGVPLTEQQREYLQTRVNESAADFKATVRAARPGIAENAMLGQVLTGARAVECKMIDQACSKKTAQKTAAMMKKMRR